MAFRSSAWSRQRKNLRREIPAWGFERGEDAAKARWNEALGQIAVEGGTETQNARVFYTALYRCFERMVNITEDGRYYSGFDHKVHDGPATVLRGQLAVGHVPRAEPLQTLLNPEMEADKIQSYVRMYQQSGIMPTFALVTGPYACMNGNHSAPWFADAWFKGVRNFDLQTAYEGVRKRSLRSHDAAVAAGPKGPLDDFYAAHGYMPALRPGEKETDPQRASIREAAACACHARKQLRRLVRLRSLRACSTSLRTRSFFLERAANYKNLFRVDKGMMWPKDADGNWIEPLDPKFDGGMGGRDYYDENNGYTYTWDVAHDFDGLIALMGGTREGSRPISTSFSASRWAARSMSSRRSFRIPLRWPDSSRWATNRASPFRISTTGSARRGRRRSACACCSSRFSRIRCRAFRAMRTAAA